MNLLMRQDTTIFPLGSFLFPLQMARDHMVCAYAIYLMHAVSELRSCVSSRCSASELQVNFPAEVLELSLLLHEPWQQGMKIMFVHWGSVDFVDIELWCAAQCLAITL